MINMNEAQKSASMVRVDREDGIATVTLNRPDKLNALNRELRLSLCQTMQELRRARMCVRLSSPGPAALSVWPSTFGSSAQELAISATKATPISLA